MIKNILFDFDGVILDSMPIREHGFKEIFNSYKEENVDKLLKFHNINGGLSRFVKIKYFFENILKQTITNDEIESYAIKFSTIMKKELIKEKYLISNTIEFITNHQNKYNFHIVSGSEDKELNFLCEKLNISNYFITINGSPTPKNNLVEDLLKKYQYNKEETILIGDSINDHEAARINSINSYGFNNLELESICDYYLYDYSDLSK
ncbi:MAG: HAD-IA family hydrolase [Campylobacterota bacterium]|nr:HAD-IA family hydrolase [Campylobacterota bacterium]